MTERRVLFVCDLDSQVFGALPGIPGKDPAFGPATLGTSTGGTFHGVIIADRIDRFTTERGDEITLSDLPPDIRELALPAILPSIAVNGNGARYHEPTEEDIVPLRELDRAGYSGDIALEYEVNEIEPPETGLARWRAVFGLTAIPIPSRMMKNMSLSPSHPALVKRSPKVM